MERCVYIFNRLDEFYSYEPNSVTKAYSTEEKAKKAIKDTKDEFFKKIASFGEYENGQPRIEADTENHFSAVSYEGYCVEASWTKVPLDED